MARPPEPQKRRELARRAVEVLRAEGLEMSMTRLAEALDIKRPTLLYHFASRGDVIEAALEDLLAQQALYVLKRVNRESHPIRRLHAQLQAVHEFHHGREERIVFLSQAVAAVGTERMTALIDVGNRVFEMHRQAQASLVRAGIAAGTVAPCDVDALMAVLRAATDGLIVQRVMTGLVLAPVHGFIWQHVLAPLVVDEPPSPTPPRP